jgi:hypothetical protein
MPNRWAVASGNWSNTATWNNGGVLGIPTASDDIYANSQSIYIDQNVTAITFRNAASASAIVASGSFYLNDGVTVNLTAANAFLATVAPLIIISGSNSARINGNNTGTGITVAPIIQMTGSATLTMSGSFIGGGGNGNILFDSSGSLILTGSYTANGGASSAHVIRMIGEGSLYLTGSLQGNGAGCHGLVKEAGSGSIYITASNLTSGGSGITIVKSSFGNIDIIGNLFANYTVITNTAGGSIRVTGDIRGGGSFFNGISNTAPGVLITVTGSVFGSGNVAYGIYNTGTNSTIIISGSVNGGTSTAPGIALVTNASTLIVTGSAVGSSTAGAIINSVASTITISGSAIAGVGGSAVVTSGVGSLTIIGPISSSISFPGIQSTSTGNVFVTGPFYNVNNRNAVFAQNLQLISGSTPTWTFDTETNLEQRTLYSANYPGNFPATTNVRQGVTFGDTGQFVGVVAIPSASNVIQGVPVDNTTGSASFTTQNAWGFPTASLTATGSIGARLRNASTVATDALLITSKKKL